jgi:hypothetical protein
VAPAGAIVSIFYDPDPGADPDVGDALRSRTGRTYIIVSARRQERGAHVGRLHLHCAVAEPHADAARVFPLVWYARK